MDRKRPDHEQSEDTKQSRWGFRGMIVWDWLPIDGTLLIPFFIAAGTWWTTWQQGKLENKRAQAEQNLAEQRAQDEAMQSYLDQMSTLLLEKDLRNSEKGSEVRTLARARTLTLLERVDARHRTEALQFLEESDLVTKDHVVVDLSGANLREVDLSWSSITHVDLHKADLRDANLHNTDLSESNLSNSDLRSANEPLLRKGGLPKIRFHDLRHTCATLLLSKNVHPKYVQELLGHATVAITLDTYSRFVPSMGTQTARAMEDALS